MAQVPDINISLNELMRFEHLVNDFSLLPRQPVHSVLSGKHASKLRGRGLDFSEVRKYVFGDDIRNIDWKVTARTKITHTKVFNEEKERPAFLIVDQSSSMFFASEGTVKSVLAAQLAAIGGFKVLKAGDRIGGLVFDDESYESFQPKRSRKTLMQILECVVDKNNKLAKRTKMQSQDDIINKVLFKAKNIITHDYVVFIVSDFKNVSKDGLKYLTSIAQHNDVIAAMISDPMEKNLPDVKLPVSNGEFQVMLSAKPEVNKNFTEESEKLKHKNLDYFQKYGIPVMEITTSEPLVNQVKRIFGK